MIPIFINDLTTNRIELVVVISVIIGNLTVYLTYVCYVIYVRYITVQPSYLMTQVPWMSVVADIYYIEKDRWYISYSSMFVFPLAST